MQGDYVLDDLDMKIWDDGGHLMGQAAGQPAFELFHQAGLAPSRTEARKLIRGGGGRLNDQPIASDSVLIKASDLGSDGTLKLSAGRKRHVLVRAA